MSKTFENPVFANNSVVMHDDSAEIRESEASIEMFSYRASVREIGGVRPQTFIDFAGRFAVISSEVFGPSNISLKIDPAHSDLTIECDELYEELAAQPGENLPTPVDSEIFAQLFSNISTADLKITRANKQDGDFDFTHVSWERRTPEIISFYAQGNAVKRALYERMFFIEGSAPIKGIDVAVGLHESKSLEEKSIGSHEYRSRGLANFARISKILGRPGY